MPCRTMLAGHVTFADGEPTHALPGRLVRHPLQQHLHVRPLDHIPGGVAHLREYAKSCCLPWHQLSLSINRSI